MARDCANSALKDSLNYASRTLFRRLPGFIAHNDARSRSVRMCDWCFFFPFFKFFLSFLALKTDKRVHHLIRIIISLQQVLVSPPFPHPVFLLKFSSALCGHFALLLQQLPFSFFFIRVCVCTPYSTGTSARSSRRAQGARVAQRELLIRRFCSIKKNRAAE